jgi:hypothetical protein
METACKTSKTTGRLLMNQQAEMKKKDTFTWDLSIKLITLLCKVQCPAEIPDDFAKQL